MNKKYRSFSKRLTQRIVYAVLLIMGIIAVVTFITAMYFMITETKGRYISIMHTSNEKLEKTLVEYVVATRNIRNEVEQNLHSTEAINNCLIHEIKLNPNILGYFAAFEPDFFPDQGRWYEPYAIKYDFKKPELVQLGSAKHDYFKVDWYQKGLKAKVGLWTEPYLDKEGAKQMVISYTQPIHDNQGKVVGIVGADIAWEWLLDKVKKIERISNESGLLEIDEKYNRGMLFNTFIISHSGNYIIHRDENRIMQGNFFEEAAATPDTIDDYVCRQMAKGKKGTAMMKVDGKSSFFIYRPVKFTDWSMAMVVPKEALYAPGIILGLVILAAILFGLQTIYWICRTFIHNATRPLVHLASSADEVAKGNFKAPLPQVNYNDEIQRLRDSFGDMQQSLVQYIEQLKTTTSEKASIESELNIANDIQQAMLPRDFTDYSNVSVYGRLRPAKYIGGDLFDFFYRDNKMFFCIGDVTGKGAPAALLMTVARSLFRAYSTNEDKPNRVISMMNKMMSENNESSLFVTLFLGVLDLSSWELLYCSAGHERPVLISDNAKLLPYIPALPVGCMVDTVYETQKLLFEPNTTLFLYTDGLTEAQNADMVFFGRERVLDVIQKAIVEKQVSPKALIERMTTAVDSFVGEADRSDDLTMLAIRHKSLSSIILKASEEEYPRMTEFVTSITDSIRMDIYEARQLRLAVEEAVGNIIDYSGATEISLSSDTYDGWVQFTITDNGSPFDPTTVHTTDLNIPADERKEGGLGIIYIRQMSDSLSYSRKDDKNVLIIRKKI